MASSSTTRPDCSQTMSASSVPTLSAPRGTGAPRAPPVRTLLEHHGFPPVCEPRSPGNEEVLAMGDGGWLLAPRPAPWLILGCAYSMKRAFGARGPRRHTRWPVYCSTPRLSMETALSGPDGAVTLAFQLISGDFSPGQPSVVAVCREWTRPCPPRRCLVRPGSRLRGSLESTGDVNPTRER